MLVTNHMHMSHHLSFIWYSIYLMFLSHLDRMGMYKRQRQASLILPFVQQLSRMEKKKKKANLLFWNLRRFMPLFKMWVGVHEKEKQENVVVIFICTILHRKRSHHEPTMALTLDDDRQECVLYTYLYISMCTHT